ncbi:MAG: MATE family efflux transporter [Clostridiales bacterium]|nr:MATE family efflux transporter [Clostridiales bacterium]
MNDTIEKNPLSSASIGGLMLKYAIPGVVALVVNALYNIVDQVFIGWGVGTLGNSATNVVFPLNMIMMALALLLGDGGAAYLSLELGRGNKKKASKGVNNTFSWLIIVAILFFIICLIFLKPLIALFGATPDNLEYALAYGRIIIIGFPFAMVGCGLCSLIRADGAPQLTMIAMVVGCVSNIILDALFVLVFGWGMEGAAIATVIGQILNFAISVWYIPHFKTVKITRSEMKPQFSLLKKVSGMGVSSFISQIAVAVLMTVINYYLVHCGAASEYGSDIPLAAFGIVMKFNTILTSIVTGIATGAQPIVGYNYGRSDYARVRKTFYFASGSATVTAVIFFIIFQAFPYQLTALFGNQGELYTVFSVMAFRIYAMLCFLNGFTTVTAIFFQSIGKPIFSGFISLSRQIIFLIPAVMILCSFMGVLGVLWAGPTADGLAFIFALLFILNELYKMGKANNSEKINEKQTIKNNRERRYLT